MVGIPHGTLTAEILVVSNDGDFSHGRRSSWRCLQDIHEALHHKRADISRIRGESQCARGGQGHLTGASAEERLIPSPPGPCDCLAATLQPTPYPHSPR